jgi:hypothetical protein
MNPIFLSYAHEDAESAREIYQLLIGNQLSVWMDEKDILPGQDWKLAIESAINQCDIFIACLSKTSVTKKGFVQKELRTAYEVLDNLPEERVFIIPVRLDNCSAPSRLKNIQWADFYSPEGKEKLLEAILAHTPNPEIEPTTFRQPKNSGVASIISRAPKKNEPFYDVGERLGIVRQELNAKSSDFFEALGLQSEREYLEMESKTEEVPLSVLKKVHNLTGVSLGWLKHGEEPRYEIDVEYFYPVKKGLEYIVKLNPKKVFFTLGLPNHGLENLLPENLSTGIVVQTGKYRYQVIDYGMSLNFWEWIENFGLISPYFEFLSILLDRYYGHNGIALSRSQHKQLFEGKIHFISALKQADGKYSNWPEAVLDTNYQKHPKTFYEKRYGKWVTKLHNSYNKIMADIALDHEFDQTLTALCDNLKNQGLDVSQLQEEIKQNQGVFAVKRLFFRNKGLELFANLKEKNLLGQSMEVLVIQRHFQPLFTKNEVAKAHQRLEEAGFFKQQ